MQKIRRVLVLVVLLATAAPAAAALRVFACEPEWAALARELGGDKVSAYAATTAFQDPHRIEARPSLIARIRNADLVVCSGAELEVGWLPLLLAQSGNARVQPGSPGYLEASQYVVRLEIPKVVDRALGDIHPAGNPHVHLDPGNVAKVGEVLAARLAQVDRANGSYYRQRADAFAARWSAAMQRWAQKAAPLRGLPVVVYHKDLTYFMHWAGMREAGALEAKPGVPPSPAHLADLVERMKRDPAKAIVYAPYSNPKAAEFLAERTGIAVVPLPFTVGGSDRAKDLFGLFDDTIDRLLAAAR